MNWEEWWYSLDKDRRKGLFARDGAMAWFYHKYIMHGLLMVTTSRTTTKKDARPSGFERKRCLFFPILWPQWVNFFFWLGLPNRLLGMEALRFWPIGLWSRFFSSSTTIFYNTKGSNCSETLIIGMPKGVRRANIKMHHRHLGKEKGEVLECY